MKRIVIMMIEDGKQKARTVEAFSKSSANLYITAPTMEDAIMLFENAEQDLQEACNNFLQEDPEEEKQGTHYVTYNSSIEEMNEKAAEFEETPRGKRFVKTLQKSIQFYFKHCKGSLKASELYYLANRHHNSLLNGSCELYAHAFCKGYTLAIKDLKEKAKK